MGIFLCGNNGLHRLRCGRYVHWSCYLIWQLFLRHLPNILRSFDKIDDMFMVNTPNRTVAASATFLRRSQLSACAHSSFSGIARMCLVIVLLRAPSLRTQRVVLGDYLFAHRYPPLNIGNIGQSRSRFAPKFQTYGPFNTRLLLVDKLEHFHLEIKYFICIKIKNINKAC